MGAVEARIGIPALCWVGQGISMILKAVLVQVFVELKLEHMPFPLGYVDPLMALCRWSGFAESRPSGGRRADLIYQR